MNSRILTAGMGVFLLAAHALAQRPPVTGKVTNERGAPLAGVQIIVRGATRGALSGSEGTYSIQANPGEVLEFSYPGLTTEARAVGSNPVMNVELRTTISLQAVVVTALGQTASQRSLGSAQQTVRGGIIAQSQRENLVNALQGRIAGADVTSTSGLPGASSLITIRGVSEISGSNQPLFILDGLPVDNKTLNTAYLASEGNPYTAFVNRGIDFTNRLADFNPEDIESITVLKGPEAAALYGSDAANGAVVITTKRGRPGQGRLEYSADFKLESARGLPQVQTTYGPSAVGSSTFLYFGTAYPAGTHFYDNVGGFFRTALTQHHNLAFSGATHDARLDYRLAFGDTRQRGVIPTSANDRINVTAASQAMAASWLKADASIEYAHDSNRVPLTVNGGPLLGLLAWPDTIAASQWLTPAGTRLRLTPLSAGAEMDNPYFSVHRNHNESRNNRVTVNVGLEIMPFSWGYLKTNVGTDAYTTRYEVLRHPASALGWSYAGILDEAMDVARHLTAQTLLEVNPIRLPKGLGLSGFLGNTIQEDRDSLDALGGTEFMDPNVVSIENSQGQSRSTSSFRRRRASAVGQAQLSLHDYLYLTGTGRNDWTRTIPLARKSSFSPSVSGSFVFTDAVPGLKSIFTTGKVRAAFALVRRAENTHANALCKYYSGNVVYSAPCPDLAPDLVSASELGTELGFLQDRLGVDATVYQKKSSNQIVQLYSTGGVWNLNGASTQNRGLELTLRGTPVLRKAFSWGFLVNYALERGKVISLPHDLPEAYVPDTWLYGNVRNGVMPGTSTMALTGHFYLRVDSAQGGHKGDLLIDPATGLPIASNSFIDRGYDRQPDFTIGVSNTFNYKRLSLDFLVDIRKGGDIFDATDHWLTVRGLAMTTLDRETPRVIRGILRDGLENTAHPTVNTIVVVPAVNTAYYTQVNEEAFIERHINWLRLKEITLSYTVPASYIHARTARVFLTITDPLLWTNYTGLDPIVNGNTAAVGGSSGVGIDYGNFPIPRGINLGFRVGF